MQKGTESFSEIEDDDFENGLLDALALERTAIQEIEQEKEENSFMEETVTVPTSKKKLWRDTQKEALTRLEDSARTEEDQYTVLAEQTGSKRRQAVPLPCHRTFGCSSGMGCSTGRNHSPRTYSVQVLETDNKG